MFRLCAAVVMVFGLCNAAIAENPVPWYISAGMGDLVGKKVRPNLEVPLRKEPPHGFFLIPGDEITKLKPNKEYEIVQWKTLPYLFSDQVWVYLRAADKVGDVYGWSYFGEDALNSKNFLVMK